MPRLVRALPAALFLAAPLAAQGFSLKQVRSYPFPNELVASAGGSRIAWAIVLRCEFCVLSCEVGGP